MGTRFLAMLCIGLLLFSCKKDEHKVISDNQSPIYSKISTIRVQNYVNRSYIDLLGREPTDIELDRDVKRLRATELAFETRDSFIQLLQKDTTYHVGDSTYRKAYCQRLYDIGKSRLLEGIEDSEIARPVGNARFSLKVARLEGDSVRVESALEIINRHMDVLNTPWRLRKNVITIDEMYAKMLNNSVYDKINMNTFNFINASFDDLFGRFPTAQEYAQSYEIIQNNKPGLLFSKSASNKKEFCAVLTGTNEFKGFMIRWAFENLNGRVITDKELEPKLTDYIKNNDYDKVLKDILITDEYAQFN